MNAAVGKALLLGGLSIARHLAKRLVARPRGDLLLSATMLGETDASRLPKSVRRETLKDRSRRIGAGAAGFHAGRECFALRRRVTVAPTNDEARLYAKVVADRLKSFVAEDERLSANVPDGPAPSGGFTLSDDEFITGTPKDVAQNIIVQCRAVGAGHFLTELSWSAPVDEVVQAHELFGCEAIPLLRMA